MPRVRSLSELLVPSIRIMRHVDVGRNMALIFCTAATAQKPANSRAPSDDCTSRVLYLNYDFYTINALSSAF